MSRIRWTGAWIALWLVASVGTAASYTNFESSHVHPIELTPDGSRLLVVNTPDAVLEVFGVRADGSLTFERAIPVGLEPVSVRAFNNSVAWVVDQLSDAVSVVHVARGTVSRTIPVGDEPTDVAFVGNQVFVSVAGEDTIEVIDRGSGTITATVPLFGRKPRALAVSPDGNTVYAVVLFSGNQTSIVSSHSIWREEELFVEDRMAEIGINGIDCNGEPPTYPPLPNGITRNPALTDPSSGVPTTGLIVRWNEATNAWEDDAGTNWNNCMPFRLADYDLFAVNVADLTQRQVTGLGTILFDASVHPSGKIYVPNTEARNHIRFEHPQGVSGHVVDNRLSIVDPANADAVTVVDLNGHIDRQSTPPTNLAERQASISQPGQLVWSADGSTGYMTAIGSRKLFVVDGACLQDSCIFGPDRNAPRAVEVGEGPSGVALNEAAQRAYVLNRFSNSIAIVDTQALTKLNEIPMHDPSDPATLAGRRFMYDAQISSAHGDSACSSCHISGDRDGLAWDLGNPAGAFMPYGRDNNNVRFIRPDIDNAAECNTPQCADKLGFDPQKGPMTTQTLRGMLEPLHWRGDKATMNEFNSAFVNLLGSEDVGPINGEPAGLSVEEMEAYRQFTLAIQFPPNPERNVDDTLPNALVPVKGHPFTGNPTAGENIFLNVPTAQIHNCTACHELPFGAAGGTLGGVEPATPTPLATGGIVRGSFDISTHSDMKVAHLRNMYEKVGAFFGDYDSAPPLARAGFGYGHDGAYPNLGVFFSIPFEMTAQDARDISAFMTHFDTGTKPAVGRHVVLPAGSGDPADLAMLATLEQLGDLSLADRHCDLVARASIGAQPRRFRRVGGQWLADGSDLAPMSTAELRELARSPVSFLCGTLGSGTRIGGDRDQDGFLDAEDCAAAAADSWGEPTDAIQLSVDRVDVRWSGLASSIGPGVRYDLLSGDLDSLSIGAPGTSCLAADTPEATRPDGRIPAPGEGFFYLVRARNACAEGSTGPGRAALDALECL